MEEGEGTQDKDDVVVKDKGDCYVAVEEEEEAVGVGVLRGNSKKRKRGSWEVAAGDRCCFFFYCC